MFGVLCPRATVVSRSQCLSVPNEPSSREYFIVASVESHQNRWLRAYFTILNRSSAGSMSRPGSKVRHVVSSGS